MGPRIYRRGYAPSPSYVDADTPNTFGGGICVLSSTLYQLALKAALPIIERHAHTRPMLTVAPGKDATVWYGGPDLKFTNPYSSPIQLQAKVDGATLNVSLHAGRFDFPRQERPMPLGMSTLPAPLPALSKCGRGRPRSQLGRSAS